MFRVKLVPPPEVKDLRARLARINEIVSASLAQYIVDRVRAAIPSSDPVVAAFRDALRVSASKKGRAAVVATLSRADWDQTSLTHAVFSFPSPGSDIAARILAGFDAGRNRTTFWTLDTIPPVETRARIEVKYHAGKETIDEVRDARNAQAADIRRALTAAKVPLLAAPKLEGPISIDLVSLALALEYGSPDLPIRAPVWRAVIQELRQDDGFLRALGGDTFAAFVRDTIMNPNASQWKSFRPPEKAAEPPRSPAQARFALTIGGRPFKTK